MVVGQDDGGWYWYGMWSGRPVKKYVETAEAAEAIEAVGGTCC